MMFSATLSHRVMELAYEHMNNPELIRIEPDKMTADRVKQVLYFPATEEKIPLLMGLLRRIDARRVLFRSNTRRIAEVLERTLTANGFIAQALSGDVPQNKRLKMMRDFHDGEIAVLIATDVASRGLHIPDVSHVFNFDLPNDAEDYVHRIGRTARAGAAGDAISFGCEEYAVALPDIERFIGHQIPRAAIDVLDLAAVTAPPPAEWRARAAIRTISWRRSPRRPPRRTGALGRRGPFKRIRSFSGRVASRPELQTTPCANIAGGAAGRTGIECGRCRRSDGCSAKRSFTAPAAPRTRRRASRRRAEPGSSLLDPDQCCSRRPDQPCPAASHNSKVASSKVGISKTTSCSATVSLATP